MSNSTATKCSGKSNFTTAESQILPLQSEAENLKINFLGKLSAAYAVEKFYSALQYAVGSQISLLQNEPLSQIAALH
jgi:hypothetical protein